MKKWYDEEYEWRIEVVAFLRAAAQSGIAEMARRLAMSIPAPTGARSMQRARESAQRL